MKKPSHKLTFGTFVIALAGFDHLPSSGFKIATITNTAHGRLGKKPRKEEFDDKSYHAIHQNESLKAMVQVLCKEGRLKEAVGLLHMMGKGDIGTDSDTYDRLLQQCIDMKSLAEGKRLHIHIMKTGFMPGVFLSNRIVDMYAKCGSMENARQVFEKMPMRSVSSWNTMISGYAKCGSVENARQLFDKMPERDGISWNSMIAGYARHGKGWEAMKLFREMRRTCMRMDKFTFGSVLSACASLLTLELGEQIHAHVIKTEFESNVVVGSALLDTYAKSGCTEYARQMFDKMPERNLVSWTTMIAGYSQNGHSEEALNLFCQMPVAEVRPNEFTFASVLSSCASLAALEHGKQVHVNVIRNGFESNVFVGSALVDMYAKCGSIESARQVFDEMPTRDIVLWNVMIVGYAQNGSGKLALELFEQMLLEGVKPDHITFIGVLSACSHAGLVDEGHDYFDSMTRDHCITPGADHYACMIALLGRAGRLDLAEEFINNMPFEPDAIVWGAMLGACRIHGDVELGKRAAECLLELDPQNAGTHVLLSNIYAAAAKWDEVAKVRKLMKERGVKKKPGCSWIEVKSRVHAFIAEDRSHPQTEEIYATLESLAARMKDEGYIPNTNFVLHDVEEEQKEHILSYHSEKLAVSFGIISTPPGTTIRIVKNLRVCGDCHTVIKFMSKIVEREIIARDANRFHYFKNGQCSCGDYW
eukprot:Gb_34248 [translate_table: standard]